MYVVDMMTNALILKPCVPELGQVVVNTTEFLGETKLQDKILALHSASFQETMGLKISLKKSYVFLYFRSIVPNKMEFY